MGLKAEDALLQVNGNSGSWNEVSDAYDTTVSVSPNMLEDTAFGNDAPARIKGLIDGNIEISVRVSDSPSTAVQDLRDAATDANVKNESLDVEFAPDGQAGATTTVVAFTAQPSELSFSASSGSAQEETYTLEVEDGSKPTVSQASLST